MCYNIYNKINQRVFIMMILKQTKAEIANTITHGLGIFLAFSGAIALIMKNIGEEWQTIFSMIIFSAGLILMYCASTVYHLVLPGKVKKILRVFDHINIYILIAASYTPILLTSVKGALGWWMFGILWFTALLGTFYKIFLLGRYPKLSLAIYLIMGWSVIFIARPVWLAVPLSAILWIAAEGIFYTVGTYFYSNDDKHQYYHAIWHLFVLAGSISHFIAVWLLI